MLHSPTKCYSLCISLPALFCCDSLSQSLQEVFTMSDGRAGACGLHHDSKLFVLWCQGRVAKWSAVFTSWKLVQHQGHHASFISLTQHITDTLVFTLKKFFYSIQKVAYSCYYHSNSQNCNVIYPLVHFRQLQQA